MAMELKVDTDADEVGFDAGRLERIDRHFGRYVEEGQLPGWLIVVTRGGRVVHMSTRGHADVEAGRPVEVDTLTAVDAAGVDGPARHDGGHSRLPA